jgi:hypothetical protein
MEVHKYCFKLMRKIAIKFNFLIPIQNAERFQIMFRDGLKGRVVTQTYTDRHLERNAKL